jgi:predicted 3-demethylubiquinone-9 3-methyltransferase (glyoxalase superfamily)
MEHAIVPNLWFDTEAEEAANFYLSVFEDSRIVNVTRYPEGVAGKAGQVLTV